MRPLVGLGLLLLVVCILVGLGLASMVGEEYWYDLAEQKFELDSENNYCRAPSHKSRRMFNNHASRQLPASQRQYCFCNPKRKLKPTISRIISSGPKTASHFFKGLQAVFCKLQQAESIFFNQDERITPARLQDGPVFQGVDYRLLVSVRCPIEYIVSSYTYYGVRGYEEGACKGTIDPQSNEGAQGIIRIRKILSIDHTVWKDLPVLPTFKSTETYSQYTRRISVHEGLLVEMLRQIGNGDHPGFPLLSRYDSDSGLDTLINNIRLLGSSMDRNIKGVCVNAISPATPQVEFERTMRSVAEFMEIPGASEWPHAMMDAFNSVRRPEHNSEADVNMNKIPKIVKENLATLVLWLDHKHFGGYLSKYAEAVKCTKLPKTSHHSLYSSPTIHNTLWPLLDPMFTGSKLAPAIKSSTCPVQEPRLNPFLRPA